jgi:hypothetical protein
MKILILASALVLISFPREVTQYRILHFIFWELQQKREFSKFISPYEYASKIKNPNFNLLINRRLVNQPVSSLRPAEIKKRQRDYNQQNAMDKLLH